MNTKDYVDAVNAIHEEMQLVVTGTSETIAEMQNHLEALKRLLDAHEYGRASLLGYQHLSVAFVSLQRSLGGVEALHTEEHALVEEMARERQCPVEEAQLLLRAPHLTAEQGAQHRGFAAASVMSDGLDTHHVAEVPERERSQLDPAKEPELLQAQYQRLAEAARLASRSWRELGRLEKPLADGQEAWAAYELCADELDAIFSAKPPLNEA